MEQSIHILSEMLEIFIEVDDDYFSACSSVHSALRAVVKKARDHTDLPELVKRTFTADLTKPRDSDFQPSHYWQILSELSNSERESVSADLMIVVYQMSPSERVQMRMNVLHSCVLASVGETEAAGKLMQRVLEFREYENMIFEAVRMASDAHQQALVKLCWDHLLRVLEVQTEPNEIAHLVRLSGKLYSKNHQHIADDESIRKWFAVIAGLQLSPLEAREFAGFIVDAPRNARRENVAKAAALANIMLPHVESLQIDADILLIPFLQSASTYRRQSGDVAGANELQQRVIELSTSNDIARNSAAIDELSRVILRLRDEHDEEGTQRAFEQLMTVCGFRGHKSLTDKEYRRLLDRHNVRSLAELAQKLIGNSVPAQTIDLLTCLMSKTSAEGLDEIDPVLSDVIRRFISRGQTEDAEAMVLARISSPASGGGASTRWLIRLSEIQLALNKLADSEHTFEKAFQITLLAGAPTHLLFQQRVDILRRAGYLEQADAMEARLPQAHRVTAPKVFFLLFATEHLSIKGNLRVGSLDGSNSVDRSALTFVRATGDSAHIGSFGTIDVSRWDGGTVAQPSSSDTKREHSAYAKRIAQIKPKRGGAADPLPVIDLDRYQIAPVLLTGGDGERKGDDIVCSIEADRYMAAYPQRIFITDEFETDSPAAILKFHEGRPRDLQIWYNGTRDIRVEHNSQVAALIYAPNARVLVGPNNVIFFGAIVAREIVAEGNLTLVFDTSLYGVDLTQI